MTDHSPSRRQFLQSASAGAALSLLAGHLTRGPVARAADAAPAGRERALRLALASYTLRNFSFEQTVAMSQRCGLEAICLKSFHLPLDASPEELAAAARRVREAGMLLYAGGVITMDDAAQVQQAFEYARAAGMQKIIAAPAPAMLPRVHDKVQECDIQVCIHNHGPGDATYPTPDVAYERIKTLDHRIGLCHDVGHTVRLGCDPIAMTEACADRLLDVHIKDVTAATPAGVTIACGRGVIDLPALLRTFVRIGYAGYLAFEYEEEPEDPLPALAESVGYIRGLLDAL